MSRKPVPSSVFVSRLNGGLLLLALFVVSLVALMLVESRAQYQERAVVNSRNLSNLLAQDLDAWLDKLDLSLLTVRDEAERVSPVSLADAPSFNEFILRQASRQPELDGLRVADAAGLLKFGTDVSPDRPVSVATAPFFQKIRAATSGELLVSEPMLSRLTGRWSIMLGRRIAGADGSFQGVVVAVLFIERLTAKFMSLDLGTHGVVSLRNLELGTVVRHPPAPNVPSTGNAAFTTQWAELVRRQPRAGTYAAVGLDGRERALAYTRVTRYPFYVIVGLDPEDYLVPWRQEAFRLLAAVIVFLTIAALLSRTLSRTWRDREAISAALLAAKAQALARSENSLQFALQAAEMGVWIFHPDDESSVASDRGKSMMGLASHDPPTLHSLLRHVGTDDRKRVFKAVQAALRTEPTDVVVRVTLPLGEARWVAWTVRWIPEIPGQPQNVIALMRDITAEKEIALEQQRKDEFLAMLSHELRGPLAPIRTSFEIMRLSDDPKVIESSAGVLDRQLRQLSALVDDLLDLSRVTQGKLRLRTGKVDLRKVIHGAVESSRPMLDTRAHRLTVALPDAPVIVEADAGRLMQVFSNLLNNAAKYTPVGGNVSVSLQAADGVAEVEVVDDGEGIPAETLPHVFKMFAQGSSPHGRDFDGLGVGLGLVERLVELHGGTVTARSAGPGCGSTFKVTLPQADPGTIAQAAPAHFDAFASGPRVSILVVDDNEDARQSLALLLERLGHEVTVAVDGPAALDIAPIVKPDIVLLDLGLPGMDGYEVASALRRLDGMEGLVIVAVTGWAEDQDRIRARQAGIDHHLTKPASLAHLQTLIDESAGGRRARAADPPAASRPR